jgi:hypothetical protein
MSQTMPPPVFDPFAPGFTDDPYPQYAALRSGAPAGRHPLGFFLLTATRTCPGCSGRACRSRIATSPTAS